MSQFVQPSRPSDRAEKHGIVCPDCGGKTSVYYTRNGPGEKILRVRECKTCGARVQTYEIVVGGRDSTPWQPPPKSIVGSTARS